MRFARQEDVRTISGLDRLLSLYKATQKQKYRLERLKVGTVPFYLFLMIQNPFLFVNL
jgi:hypothetical protein